MTDELDEIQYDPDDPIFENFKDVIGKGPGSQEKKEEEQEIPSKPREKKKGAVASKPSAPSDVGRSSRNSRKASRSVVSDSDRIWHDGYFAGMARCSCYIDLTHFNLLKFICAKKGKSVHSLISSLLISYLDACKEEYVKEMSEVLDELK